MTEAPLADVGLCWVLTELEPPHVVKAASPLWYATWQIDADNAVGKATTKELLCQQPGFDEEASAKLMAGFAATGRGSARCTNSRMDGTLVSHTVDMVLGRDFDSVHNNPR